MEIIKKCFDEFDSVFSERLIAEKFSDDQVNRFLVEASSAILNSAEKVGVFQTMHCLLSEQTNLLFEKIDVVSIAKKSAMDSCQVITGIQVIAPILLSLLSQNSVVERLRHDVKLSYKFNMKPDFRSVIISHSG